MERVSEAQATQYIALPVGEFRWSILFFSGRVQYKFKGVAAKLLDTRAYSQTGKNRFMNRFADTCANVLRAFDSFA